MPSEPLSQRLAEVARAMRSEPDPLHTLEQLVHVAREWTGDNTSVGITLVHKRRAVESVATTDDLVREGDRLQYELKEGPCLDAVWEEEQVYSGDLPSDARWPTWGPRIAELGVRSMLCTQLFTNEAQLGALNIYSADRYAFDADVRAEVMPLAAHAAVAVGAALQIEQLTYAVDRRTVIGKAIGIVMERFGIDDRIAFEVLTRISSQENRKLYDVANELVRTGELPR